jgi:hypothetical protein
MATQLPDLRNDNFPPINLKYLTQSQHYLAHIPIGNCKRVWELHFKPEERGNMSRNWNTLGDRRTKKRFELCREIRYQLWNGRHNIGSGSGWTLDLSSKGVAFTTDGYIQPGASIEISVSWPVLLNGDCAMRLVACGYVVRSALGMAACRISQFEFRTQPKVMSANSTMGAAAA